jgi:hypothetical protein
MFLKLCGIDEPADHLDTPRFSSGATGRITHPSEHIQVDPFVLPISALGTSTTTPKLSSNLKPSAYITAESVGILSPQLVS